MAAAAREPVQHKVVGGPIRKKGIGAILAPLGGLARRAWGSLRSVRPPSPSTVLAALLAAALLRIAWQSQPKWLKRTITRGGRRRRRRGADDEASALSTSDVDADSPDDDDVLAPEVIAQKLQSILDLASKKLETASTLRSFELYASLLALLQLTNQFEVRVGEERDDLYSRSGDAIGADEVPINLVDRLRMTDWAYLEETSELRSKLKGLNLTMVRHVKLDEPGRVGHYIAIDPEEKLAYIVAKGTSDLSDMVTDACGVPARHELSRSPFGPDYERDGGGGGVGNITFSCHEGILEASRSLADDVQPLVEHLFLPSGFRLILMGHSLGAGVACMVGTLLRSRLPKLMRDGRSDDDDGGGGTMRVLAFAPPPILNHRAAVACSPFVTSVVNNLDVIPRASLSNVVVLLDLLRVVNDRLEERGLSPRDVTSIVALLRKLSEWEEGDMIMTPEEVLEGFEEARGKIDTNDPDHLFVPGKVLVVYERSRARILRDRNVTDMAASGAEIFKAIVSDGAAAVLQYIAIDGRMIEDHMPVAYEKTLRGLRIQNASKHARNLVKEVVP